MDRGALDGVAPHVAALTEVEGLASHGEAVARRVRP
jgi:histidinol dehydrogenase